MLRNWKIDLINILSESSSNGAHRPYRPLYGIAYYHFHITDNINRSKYAGASGWDIENTCDGTTGVVFTSMWYAEATSNNENFY